MIRVEIEFRPEFDIAMMLTTAGFGIVATGHQSWAVTANRRPLAARTLGLAGLLIAGSSLPLLGLRKSSFATVLLRDDAGGSWVDVEGSLAAEVAKVLTTAGALASAASGSPIESDAARPEVATPSRNDLQVEYSSLSAPTPTWTPPPAAHDDNTTMVGAKVAELRQNDGGVLRLAFDTGEVVVVDREVLVGRAPVGGPDVRLVPINDPEGSVSKLHFVLRPGTGVTWIRDDGSTNGTGLIRQGGALEELTAGAPTPLSAGDTIVFGRRRATVSDG